MDAVEHLVRLDDAFGLALAQLLKRPPARPVNPRQPEQMHGYAGFIANNAELTDHPARTGAKRPGGILYRDGIAKISQSSPAFNALGIPLVALQGFAVFDFGNNSFDRMFIPRVDFWGNIVVAGFVSGPVGVNIDMAVWRYLADGSLDPSFANGAGFLTHHNAAGGNGADLALNLAFDAQGRIVLSGYSTNSVPDLDATIWRIR